MDEIAHATDGDHGAQPQIEPHGPAHAGAAHADAARADAARADAARADAAQGDHGQGAPLGPVDWAAWGAGLLGIAAGLLVAACLYLSATL